MASGIAQGFPPPADQRVTLANWDSPPFNRWAFQHVREIMPTVEVRRGSGHAARPEIDLRDLERAAKLLATFAVGLKKGQRFKVKV